MSGIDPSKLKEALDDFVEKESLIKEEIKVVEQQIEELKARTITCNERLERVGQDRQRVLDIASRYSSGSITAQGAAVAREAVKEDTAAKSLEKPVEVKSMEAKAQAKMEAKAEAKAEKEKPATAEKTTAPIKTPPPTPAKTPPAAKAPDSQEAVKGSGQEPEKESAKDTGKEPEAEDDTVKNINEALRGLFR
jgi:hypothetical protein